MKTLKVSIAGALALATFFVLPSSMFAAAVNCPSPALTYDMSRGNSTDANTGGQVSSLQAFLWQYKSIYPDWSFPASRENFVVGIYGRRTEAVVKDFQKTFMPSVVGTSGYGKVGPLTRGEILNQCSIDNRVSISQSAIQPIQTLAPRNTIVPFTNISLYSYGEVFLSSMVVERNGVGDDRAFKEILLIANSGVGTGVVHGRIIASGSLNPATHTAVLAPRAGGISFVANQSADLTIAGLMAGDESCCAGQYQLLSLKEAIFTTSVGNPVTVLGQLPIYGTGQTVNNSLTLVSVTATTNGQNQLTLMATGTEDMVLAKIIAEKTGGSVDVNSVNYTCSQNSFNSRLDVCDFGNGIVGKNALIVFASPYATYDNRDIVIKGKTYGYRVVPSGVGGVAGSGGFAVTLDTSSPVVHQWVAAGSTGVTMTQLRFTSTSTENVALTNLRLQAQSGKGDNAGQHIASISLWDGSQLISSKISPAFTNGYEDFQFPSGGAGSFVIPANSYKRMTVKINVASICAGCSGVAGSPVYVDFDGDGTSLGKNTGVGFFSGLSIRASSVQDTMSSGITYFRSVPTFSFLPLPTAVLVNGEQTLYKFRVTANPAYDIALHKITFLVATTGVVSMASQYPSFRLYNITENRMTTATAASAIYFKSPKNYDSNGNLIVRAYASGDYVNEIRIPAGQSRDFSLLGSVFNNAIGSTVGTKLLGDSIGLGSGMSQAKIPLDIGYDSKVIWSDYSGELAGSHSLLSSDWTNGLHVPGLPSTGLMTAVLSGDSIAPPPAPANITATPINTKPIGISLLWQDNSSNETNFVLERSASTNFTSFIVATTTKANITSYTDRAVATSTMYYYRVKARNAGGDSGYSNIVSAVINPIDLGPPVINIVKPTSGSTYQATSTAIYLAAVVSDDVGVARVEWKNMTTGAIGGLMLAGSYWTNLITGLVQGNNQIVVTAYDAVGNSSSDQLLVTYNADSAAYSFNSTVLVDATGHGVPATNYGATLTSAGKFNEAFSFSGVGDYVKVGLLNNPTAYTLEAWVKPADTTNRNIIVRTNSSGPSSVWSHEIAVSNGKFIHYTFDTAAKVVRGTTSIVPDTWYYVAVVAQNNGQARLYVNGVEEGTPVSVGTLWAGGDRYLVGSNASFASIYTAALANFKGTIDEVRIYHRALTRDEIINDMNSSTQIAQAQPSKSIATQSTTRSSLASILQAISALTEQLQLYIRGF